MKAAAASASLWTTLGVHAALGRLYGEAEDRPPDGTRVVVLGHDLWRNSFGADPSVLGRSLHIGSADYQVIGVLPEGFSGPDVERVDLWLPATAVGRTVLGAFTGDDPWWRCATSAGCAWWRGSRRACRRHRWARSSACCIRACSRRRCGR